MKAGMNGINDKPRSSSFKNINGIPTINLKNGNASPSPNSEILGFPPLKITKEKVSKSPSPTKSLLTHSLGKYQSMEIN